MRTVCVKLKTREQRMIHQLHPVFIFRFVSLSSSLLFSERNVVQTVSLCCSKHAIYYSTIGKRRRDWETGGSCSLSACDGEPVESRIVLCSKKKKTKENDVTRLEEREEKEMRWWEGKRAKRTLGPGSESHERSRNVRDQVVTCSRVHHQATCHHHRHQLHAFCLWMWQQTE